MNGDVKPFYKLYVRTSHHLNERISKWAHLSKAVLQIFEFKVRKRVDFLGRFSPYEIPESGDRSSNFLSFQNCF